MASAVPARVKKPLTWGERRVLIGMCLNLTGPKIAELLGCCNGTVRSNEARIRQKLGIRGMTRVEMGINLNASVKDAYLHPRPYASRFRDIDLNEFDDTDPTPEGSD